MKVINLLNRPQFINYNKKYNCVVPPFGETSSDVSILDIFPCETFWKHLTDKQIGVRLSEADKQYLNILINHTTNLETIIKEAKDNATNNIKNLPNQNIEQSNNKNLSEKELLSAQIAEVIDKLEFKNPQESSKNDNDVLESGEKDLSLATIKNMNKRLSRRKQRLNNVEHLGDSDKNIKDTGTSV